MNRFLEVAIEASKKAGAILVDYMGKVDVKEKNPRDLVTQADVASQEEIQKVLLSEFPDHLFLGEEGEFNGEKGSERELLESGDSEYAWIVDPLDGTTNFVHQLRSFSVSIALTQNQLPIAGVVYDPLCNECFYAERGGGAFLNGKPISVTDCKDLNHAMVVTGFSTAVTKDSIEAKRFLEMLGKAQSIRRLGSAALNLCFLGCGRVDSYWASSLNAWDIAAGMLIVEEAGGFVRAIEGDFDLFRPNFIASCTPELGQSIFETIDIAG